MSDRPDTHYVKAPDGVRIAYQVFGEGPVDLVFVPGLVSNLEMIWDNAFSSRFFSRLGAFARVVLFDKRGMGLSDRHVSMATLEEARDDVIAVMDAAGVERAALMGYSEGGPVSVFFALAHPDRVQALVLCDTFARLMSDPGEPGPDGRQPYRAMKDAAEHRWGSGSTTELWLPSLTDVDSVVAEVGRAERTSASPTAVLALIEAIGITDVRALLPSIRVPTLVVHRTGDAVVPVERGRYLAETIPGAVLLEQDGDEHFPWVGASDELLDAVEEFLTGARPSAEPDRVLATVMLTDVVGSTEVASDLGDRQWHGVLDALDGTIAEAASRHKGTVVKSTGDGHLVTFDGPGRAVRCAGELRHGVEALGISIRTGIHTGEVEVRGDDIGGIAVHIAARVMNEAGPGQVLVSQAVPVLVAGSGLEFEQLGERELKGVPGAWTLYEVVS